MDNIEKKLQSYSKEEFEVPQKVHYRVQYTLKNKEKSKEWPLIKKLVTMMASLIVIFIGSISVYAVCGGTIEGKPIIEWLGIKFSSEYEEYKVNVEGQKLTNNNGTSISLTDTVCDEGFTILEFDVNLSDEDKEKLKIGEPILTEEYMNIPPEEISLTADEKAKVIEEYGEKLIDSIYVSLNNELITDEMGTYLNGLNNYSIIIDGENYWIRPRSAQTTTKISDNEYKIYQLYFLTDKELGDKKEFTISLNNIVIEANETQFNSEEVYLPIDGQFDVSVSKEKAIKNTKIFVPECEEVKNKNMTKKIEKVIDTPLQTIVKVSTIYENVSLKSLTDNKRDDYIDIIEYMAYNENGTKLGTFSYETKRTITYEDGTVEEWEQGDIGTSKNFENANMELTEYIIIEKNKENSKITIELKEQHESKPFGKFEFCLND